MIIESYRLLEPLGRGSFGEVWRVEFCKEGPRSGQFYAAKISYQPFGHEDTMQEMFSSLPIVSLKHPHILKLYTSEGFSDGRLMLVMELADGNLLDRCRQFRNSGATFPSSELILYLRQAAEALDFIHEQSLIHGGINPGDILLLNEQAKIADPGPPISSDQPFARIQTANLSKFFCMAPERKRGINHFQSDQYALGATYAWLRADRPALGLDVQPEELRSIRCFSEPEQEVLLKALSLDPDHRYPSCVEFVDSLKRAVIKG